MNLTEIEKAAVLLIALGPQRAQPILERLGAADLVPIIDAMKRMGQIAPEIRRTVLEEVNRLLTDRAAGRTTRAQPSSGNEPGEGRMDLFDRLGPYLPDRIDPDGIDWDGAGLSPPEDGQ